MSIRFILITGVLLTVTASVAASELRNEVGVLWQVPFDAECRQDWQPVIVGSEVYVPSWHGMLHAFDITDGELVWSFPVEGEGATKDPEVLRSSGGDSSGLGAVLAGLTKPKPAQGVVGSPRRHGDALYILGRNFTLYKFDPVTRDLKWSFDAKHPLVEPAVVRDQAVHFVAGSVLGPQTLYTVLSSDGSAKWSFEHEEPIDRLLLNGDTLLYTTQRTGSADRAQPAPTELTLRAAAADTGQELWSLPTGVQRHEFEGPVASGPMIYFTTQHPRTQSVAEIVRSTDDKKLRSRARRLMKREGPDSVLETSKTVSLHAVGAASGSEAWRIDRDAPLASFMISAPLVSESVVIFASEAGVYAVDPMSGKPRWSFDHEVAPQLYLGEHLYVCVRQAGSGCNAVAALDLATGAIAWSGPSRDNLWIQAISKDAVYVSHGTGMHAISALSTRDGGDLWTFETGKNEPCTGPVEVGDGLIFGTGMDWTHGKGPVHGSLYRLLTDADGID
jgi:outer membrane protein assembly factor BamB